MKRKSNLKGFTLIELLIVVAIIGILAAIAIPNFLQAQTRAKVARAKADQRSIATAIEAYIIDANHYPQPTVGWPEGCAQFRLYPITTPIDYISSIPGDPFATDKGLTCSEVGDQPSFIYLLDQYHLFGVTWDVNHQEFRLCVNSREVEWTLTSQGPWQAISPTSWIDWYLYDPTNGTVSKGIIIRSGP